MTLGETIRQLREKRGMTLRALARTIGVSAAFLSDLEHDRRHTDKLEEIASALRVSAADLRALDTRLPFDLKKWIEENPKVVALLRDMKKHNYFPRLRGERKD